jgi:putative ABC transport system permease protein
VSNSDSWFSAIFGESDDDYAIARTRTDADLERVVEDVRNRLREIRGLKPEEDDTFSVSTQESLFDTYKQLTRSTYWVMRIVASVALLVSGIGIMNIMLVAVMERTSEIGLRKAVGAPRSAIAGQFLVESVVLTLFGGAIGIGLGYLIRLVVAAVSSLPATVPVWSIPLALGICCAIGVFFGSYPAIRAARLDPVRALHYE